LTTRRNAENAQLDSQSHLEMNYEFQMFACLRLSQRKPAKVFRLEDHPTAIVFPHIPIGFGASDQGVYPQLNFGGFKIKRLGQLSDFFAGNASNT
jgi:hypothetical protein